MKVTFLGTGTSQGVPSIGCDCEVCSSLDFRDKRLRTSIHIEANGNSFVIDAGPDFRQQMLRERINHLDAVIFTHEHKDHTAGLDDIRPFNFKQNSSMPVYGRKNVLESLKREYSYAFSEHKYPGIPLIDLIEIENKPFNVKGVTFTPIEVIHCQLPVFGYRINDFTYITDANAIAENEMDKIRGSRVVVLNALHRKEHISHYNLDQAIEVLNELKPEMAYLVHMSHNMGLHRDVEKILPNFIQLAYDGLRLEI
ncbi:MAG TPA: MBL fold metallo-hydrolase [Cytophagaceae bacterium]